MQALSPQTNDAMQGILSGRQLTRLLLALSLFTASPCLFAQEKTTPDNTCKPLQLKLSDDGSRYVRLLMWQQVWLETNNLDDKSQKTDLNVSLRRSRFLAYAQLSPRLLVLMHWGLNSLNASNLSKLGNDADSPQMFLHDAWTEFKVADQLYLGGGLIYWNGLTRLASQSTISIMSLDQSRPFVHWHSMGYTDQVARHLGLYAKGEIGKFHYRMGFKEAGNNGYEANMSDSTHLTYNGVNVKDKNGHTVGTKVLDGYFCYSFLDKEADKLPYFTGSYLGTKKVLNIGAGYFLHPNGAYNGATKEHVNVQHFAVDAFLDMPLGSKGSLTAYASYIHFDYGPDWVGKWAGTGSNLYFQAGYYFKHLKVMPYVVLNHGLYEGNSEMDRQTTDALDVGVNYFIEGQHAKLTLEYHTIRPAGNKGSDGLVPGDVSQVRLQAAFSL